MNALDSLSHGGEPGVALVPQPRVRERFPGCDAAFRQKPAPALFKLVFLLFLSLAPFLTAAEDTATRLFETANKLYEERKFPEAAATYEAILEAGRSSAEVYFNLGNARFKASQIGAALVAYRHAARLAPRDPDVKANLQFARNQVQGPTLRATRWQRAFSFMTLNEWAGLAVTAFWLTFLLLAAMQLRPTLRPLLGTLTLMAGGMALALSVCLVVSSRLASTRDLAVVKARDVIVRNGPLEESQTAFTASDGAELRVLDQKDDWLQVTDGTRRIGWLKRSEVARF